jgi:hypothetical protein
MKCREKRQVFHRCKRKYNHIKNKHNKTNMKNASKLNKTQLNKSYCEYQDKTAILLGKSQGLIQKVFGKYYTILIKKILMLVIM